MSKTDLIRGWKNPTARTTNETEAHPAGAVELNDAELTSISGGTTIPSSFHCPTSPFGPEPWCQLK